MRVEFEHDPATSGFRLVVAGDGVRRMPELRGSELREWNHRYALAFGPLLGTQGLEPHDRTMNSFVDALLEYDRHGELGGREWLKKHLTDEQIVLILQRIQAAHA
jgi:hypothetical protein